MCKKTVGHDCFNLDSLSAVKRCFFLSLLPEQDLNDKICRALDADQILLFALMNAPQLASAEEDFWAQTKVSASSAWEHTKVLASEAADWTVKQSRTAWQATSEAANEAADWTSEKAAKGWQATREMAEDIKS